MNRAAQEIGGGIGIPESGHHLGQENDGFFRIDVDMTLHLDVLKNTLPKEDASDGASGAGTTKQMSLDLEDLW